MQHNSSEKCASTISPIAPAIPSTAAPRVPCLNIPIADAHGWVLGLTDYETGWFFRLLLSSAAAEPQGYLVNSSNLWRVAGARRPDFWESHKSNVLARFNSQEMDGRQMLWFPPRLEIIHNGSEKLRNYRARNAHSLTGIDPKNKNQKQSEREPRAKSEEHENAATTDRRPTPRDRSIFG